MRVVGAGCRREDRALAGEGARAQGAGDASGPCALGGEPGRRGRGEAQGRRKGGVFQRMRRRKRRETSSAGGRRTRTGGRRRVEDDGRARSEGTPGRAGQRTCAAAWRMESAALRGSRKKWGRRDERAGRVRWEGKAVAGAQLARRKGERRRMRGMKVGTGEHNGEMERGGAAGKTMGARCERKSAKVCERLAAAERRRGGEAGGVGGGREGRGASAQRVGRRRQKGATRRRGREHRGGKAQARVLTGRVETRANGAAKG